MNQNSFTGNHIFIVEDDPVMQYILKRYFPRTSVVAVFNNGQECLSALQSGTAPDLVITDLNTPLLNGIQLIRAMKTSDRLCRIPVMVMSADNSSGTILKCLSAGADDYLLKPFLPEDLFSKITHLLRRTHKNSLLMPA